MTLTKTALWILFASRGSKNRPALLIDPGNRSRCKVKDRPSILGDEPLISVAKAVNFSHAVALVKLQHKAPNDIIQAGAQTATRHNGGAYLGRVEKDFAAWTGRLKRGELIDGQIAIT